MSNDLDHLHCLCACLLKAKKKRKHTQKTTALDIMLDLFCWCCDTSLALWMNRHRSGLKIRHTTKSKRWAENDSQHRALYTHWHNTSKTTGDIHVLHCENERASQPANDVWWVERWWWKWTAEKSWHEIRCRCCAGCHTIIIYTCTSCVHLLQHGKEKLCTAYMSFGFPS